MHVHERIVTYETEGLKFEFLNTLVCCWNVHHGIIYWASERDRHEKRSLESLELLSLFKIKTYMPVFVFSEKIII